MHAPITWPLATITSLIFETKHYAIDNDKKKGLDEDMMSAA